MTGLQLDALGGRARCRRRLVHRPLRMPGLWVALGGRVAPWRWRAGVQAVREL